MWNDLKDPDEFNTTQDLNKKRLDQDPYDSLLAEVCGTTLLEGPQEPQGQPGDRFFGEAKRMVNFSSSTNGSENPFAGRTFSRCWDNSGFWGKLLRNDHPLSKYIYIYTFYIYIWHVRPKMNRGPHFYENSLMIEPWLLRNFFHVLHCHWTVAILRTKTHGNFSWFIIL